MKLIVILVVGLVLIYFLVGGMNGSSTINDNYGQYDKGTALCDKGAAGDTIGACD